MNKEQFLQRLAAEYCEVSPDTSTAETATLLHFKSEQGRVKIRIIFDDWQTGGKLTIFNIEAYPRNQGLGSAAMQSVIEVALSEGCESITGWQVQRESHTFWTRLGFKPMTEELSLDPSGWHYQPS
jgi:GNAT superfamily N-acetyltransferase